MQHQCDSVLGTVFLRTERYWCCIRRKTHMLKLRDAMLKSERDLHYQVVQKSVHASPKLEQMCGPCDTVCYMTV